MKSFKIEHKDLANIANFCGRGVSSKPLVPAYKMLVFSLSNGTLKVRGINHVFGVYDSIRDVVGDDVEFAVDGFEFNKLIGRLSGELELSFNAMDKRVVIKADTGKYRLWAESPTDYPRHDSSNASRVLKINAAEIKSAIKVTSTSIVKDELRPQLSNMLIKNGSNGLHAAGVSFFSLSILGPLNGECLVDDVEVQVFPEIFQSIGGFDGEVLVYQNSAISIFKAENGRVVAQQKSLGPFPAYEPIVPKTCEYNIEVSRDGLLGSMHRLIGVAGMEGKLINISISGNRMSLSANDIDSGSAGEESMEIVGEASIDIMISGTQMQKTLCAMLAEKVSIGFNSPKSPVLIKDDESGIVSVLMPFTTL